MNPWITFALWMLGLFVVVFVITTLYLWLEDRWIKRSFSTDDERGQR